jgi:hypothetical protein
MTKAIAIIIIVGVMACVIRSIVGCRQFPVISVADSKTGKDFVVDYRGSVRVSKVDVWSSSKHVFLWTWEIGDAKTFDYGIVPETAKQIFPLKNATPREIAEGEEIVVSILYFYDSAWPPAACAGNETKAFRKVGRKFIPIPLTHTASRVPKWKTDEERQEFEKRIDDEIAVSQPLFLRLATGTNATPSQKTLIDAMKRQVGEQVAHDAYIELRSEDIFAFYGQKISDITILTDFKNISKLVIYEGEVTDVRPLAKLKGLTFLRLEHNNIHDLGPLLELQNLERLYITGNHIKDRSVIDELRKKGVEKK